MALTHREFYFLMTAETEKRYDKMELAAANALMMRVAYHTSPKKRLKANDLFKRPTDTDKEKTDKEAIETKLNHQQEWLSQFDFSEGGEG